MIEDVDYLLENSEQNSLTIFIDSKNRDRSVYPTPSQYVVDFQQPIRNVFGIEILDATMPVTTYNIDAGMDRLAITNVFVTKGVDANNDVLAIFRCVQYSDAFDHLFSSVETTMANIFVCRNRRGFDAMTNVLDDASAYSEHLILYYSSCTVVPVTDAAHTLTIDGVVYGIQVPFLALGGTTSVYVFNQVNTIFYFEWKYCTDAQVNAYIASVIMPDTTIGLGPFDVLFCNSILTCQHGNYSIDSLLTYMNSVLLQGNAYNQYIKLIPNSQVEVSYLDTVTKGNASITSVYQWNSGRYPVILDMKKCTMDYVLGFSSFAITCTKYMSIVYRDNKQLFMSLLPPPPAAQDVEVLVTPGIVNLESARFILLRCPEIENQMLGSYANFVYAPGISLFKMTDTNSMQQLRFDFVNIVRRPFHPIGKLQKISFSFENQDTSLYDFKGVDHQLLISIKYYSPKNKTRMTRSVLNPNYNPDILAYRMAGYDADNREDETEYDVDDVILQQQKYLNMIQ